jgi:hypothetical protein
MYLYETVNESIYCFVLSTYQYILSITLLFSQKSYFFMSGVYYGMYFSQETCYSISANVLEFNNFDNYLSAFVRWSAKGFEINEGKSVYQGT